MTASGTSDPEARSRPARSRIVIGLVSLFLALIAIYHVNATVLDEGDAVPSINLPIALLETGGLSFTPERFPEMFKWHAKKPFIVTDDFYFVSYKQMFGGKPAATWKKAGYLTFNGPRYYIVKATARDAYVSTFGPVPGLMMLPLAAVVHAIDPGLRDKFLLKLSMAKLFGSSLVASTALLVFFAALRFVSGRVALLLALAFGVGTCAWAISSQNIWQQTAHMFLLSAGAAAFVHGQGRVGFRAVAGFFLGAAVATRATSAVVFLLAALHLFIYDRRTLVAFALASLPVPLAVGAYNLHFFGSPFQFAQELVGHDIAREKTGSPDLFQTPLWKGAAGLLFSPSRGLIVLSPFLALSFWGAARALRDARYRDLRPFIVASGIIMAIQAKWFDWWGGWAYGYRPWVDLCAYLVLFIVPVVGLATATRLRRIALGAALTWSVFVQGLGAMTYDRSWNVRWLYVLHIPKRGKPFALTSEEEARALAKREGGVYIGPTACDIDRTFCRYRLWSISDNMVHYYLTHFEETRGRRLPPGWQELGEPL